VLFDFAVGDHSANLNDLNGNFAEGISPGDTAEDEEAVMRRTLALPNRPAAAYIHFANIKWRLLSAADGMNVLASYYDTPAISLKHAFYSKKQLDNGTTTFWSSMLADDLHPNAQGHRLAALLLIYYVQTHVLRCDTAKVLEAEKYLVPETELPMPVVPFTKIPADPAVVGCYSIQNSDHNLTPSSMEDGWAYYDVNNKMYYRGTKVGAHITFEWPIRTNVTVSMDVDVFLFSLTASYSDGVASCWLDGRKSEAVTISGKAEGQPAVSENREWITINGGRRFFVGKLSINALHSGTHNLTCSLVSGSDFRIIAIFYG
jgi:hypothetical protein